MKKTVKNKTKINININNTNFNEVDFIKILSFKTLFPSIFENYCKRYNCTDDNTFKNLSFIEELFYINSYSNNISIFNTNKSNTDITVQIKHELNYILLKYKLMKEYKTLNLNFKTEATPLLRFFNGFLENSKSRHCINIHSTPQDILFTVQNLEKIRPIDILRKIINDSKCKKIITLFSNQKIISTFIKSLFDYSSLVESNLESLLQFNSTMPTIIDILIPKAFTSFIFEIHEEDKIKYVKIFFNLIEINNIKGLKLQLPYDSSRGIIMDDLISYLNELTDFNIKYKQRCE